jgi:zinc transporter ZupT
MVRYLVTLAIVAARYRARDLGVLFGLAASATVYITLDELVPEVYTHGEGHGATLGIAFGVIAAPVLMGLI